MGIFDKFKKEKSNAVIKQPHSNRGESLEKEMNVNDSSQQWDEMKKDSDENVNSVMLEQEMIAREKEALSQRKKIFDEVQIQKVLIEQEEYDRVLEIEQKIKNKKKREIKRRDIAFRNRSTLG